MTRRNIGTVKPGNSKGCIAEVAMARQERKVRGCNLQEGGGEGRQEGACGRMWINSTEIEKVYNASK